MLLLLHDQKFNDFYSKSLVENRKKLSCPLKVLSVDDLLHQCQYEYDQQGSIFLLKHGKDKIFTDRVFLLNRLIRLKAKNFEIKDCSPRAFFKYSTSFLSLLVRSFSRVSNSVGESCLSGSYHPLNMQWYLVKKNFDKINVPDFDFSFGYKINEIKFKDPITANPNDFSSVLLDKRDLEAKASMHTFRFAKPAGNPYVCYFSGEYFDIKPLGDSKPQISEEDFLHLSKLKSYFGLFAGEIIFFKNKDRFVFGSINHYYDQANKYEDSVDIIIKGVNDTISLLKEKDVG